ncbi:MAG: hypothetical protein WDA27_04315 [Actinomycetota bacterium]
MRRTIRLLPTVFVVLTACSGTVVPSSSPVASPEHVRFRALVERAGPSCVEAPEWALATDEAEWIDVFDRETDCRPDADVMLPEVDFGRQAGLAVWWASSSCAEAGVRTESVERAGAIVTVRAVTIPPPRGCRVGHATLESMLALDRWEGFAGVEQIRLVLDGRPVRVSGTEE